MTHDAPEPRDSVDELELEQGGGPPGSMLPWTLIVESEGWSADLEHGAPVPRVGDRIEYIDDDASRRFFRVEAVTHTVQKSASERPPVRAEEASPNAAIIGGPTPARATALRAGLPRVYVVPDD